MAESHKALTWSPEPWILCYDSIKYNGSVSEELLTAIKPDLLSVLVVPKQDPKSKAALAKGESGEPVAFHSGAEYRLNAPFIAAAVSVASELDLDEIAAAELLQNASEDDLAQSASLSDAGILLFLKRYAYIINILGHLVANRKLHILYQAKPAALLLSTILASFNKLYSLASIQNDFVDKQKASSNITDIQFVMKVAYIKKQVFNTHELLAQLLFALFDNYIDELGASLLHYESVIQHINASVKSDSDILLLHFYPTLMRIVSCLRDLPDAQVHALHAKVLKVLTQDYPKVSEGDLIDLLKSSIRPFEVLLDLMFLVFMIPWCKDSPDRTEKYDFENDILKYIEWIINYGLSEHLLCYTAESATDSTKDKYERRKLYDFRSLLQRSVPRLTPVLFKHPNHDQFLQAATTKPEYANLKALCDFLDYSLSSDLRDSLLAPSFHLFFATFINSATIVLTLVRDSEEDFLLASMDKKSITSGERGRLGSTSHDDYFLNRRSNRAGDFGTAHDGGLDLDEIASKAELERIYLSCTYTYSDRPVLCEAFWESDNAQMLGFVNWGLMNNTSPLITATFCLFLGSLTYGGEASSARTWDLLNHPQDSSKRNDYSRISIDSILSSLSYYIDSLRENFEVDLREQLKLNKEKQEVMLSSGKYPKEKPAPLTIQLSEDSIVFIAGFLMLISDILENAGLDAKSNQLVKQAVFVRFQPVITRFLRFDNFVTAAANSFGEENSVPIVFSDENRSAIVNLILSLLANLAHCDNVSSIRCRIWTLVDRWVCHAVEESEHANNQTSEIGRYSELNVSQTSQGRTMVNKLKNQPRAVTPKQGFRMVLTNICEVYNFTKLMEALLRPIPGDVSSPISLLYPSDLGITNRVKNQVGVWPYIEFLFSEVFAKSVSLKDDTMRFSLQSCILSIASTALNEIDWPLLSTTAPRLLDGYEDIKSSIASAFNSKGDDIVLCLRDVTRLHHSVAIINSFFDPKTSATLFAILNLGIDKVEGVEKLVNLLKLALTTLQLIFRVEKTFVDSLLPALNNLDPGKSNTSKPTTYGTSMSLLLASARQAPHNVYFPSDLGTKGFRSYFELVSFNLECIVHISLYVGSQDYELSGLALDVLQLIYKSAAFSASSGQIAQGLLLSNRTLTILESVDESERVKFGFAQQLNSQSSIETKSKFLEFILSNLSAANRFTISHFFLGFKTRADRLHFDGTEPPVLLLLLLETMLSALDFMVSTDFSHGFRQRIEWAPTKLNALIMEILVRLCSNPISSKITLKYLRQYGLFEKLLGNQPKIDDMTIWQNSRFQGDVLVEQSNLFIIDDISRDCFLNYINFRNLTLQYLSLELHDNPSDTETLRYIDLLLDGSEYLDGTPKILNYLNVLNYQITGSDAIPDTSFERKFRSHFLGEILSLDSPENWRVLPELTNLECRAIAVRPMESETLNSRLAEITARNDTLQLRLQTQVFETSMKDLQIKSLHSWAQVVQVLTNKGLRSKEQFVQQVLQVILPMINSEFYENEVLFAEELIPLCVYLVDMYDVGKAQEGTTSILKIVPLFKTCLNGLICSNINAEIRADLYLLINKFMMAGQGDAIVLAGSALTAIDKKVVDVICNDLLYSEGITRITSLILLETMIQISLKKTSTRVLSVLVENNSILLLVRSLKRTDEILVACEASAQDTTEPRAYLDTLVYELIAMKTTLSLLTRIGQTRLGASQLVQNEVISVLGQLRLLHIDADMGLEFNVHSREEAHFEAGNVKFALELLLEPRNAGMHQRGSSRMSLYEIMIPCFQLVATVLISMGPSHKPGLAQAKQLMSEIRPLITSVMKRDITVEEEAHNARGCNMDGDASRAGLQLMVKLFTLLDSLVFGAENADAYMKGVHDGDGQSRLAMS